MEYTNIIHFLRIPRIVHSKWKFLLVDDLHEEKKREIKLGLENLE